MADKERRTRYIKAYRMRLQRYTGITIEVAHLQFNMNEPRGTTHELRNMMIKLMAMKTVQLMEHTHNSHISCIANEAAGSGSTGHIPCLDFMFLSWYVYQFELLNYTVILMQLSRTFQRIKILFFSGGEVPYKKRERKVRSCE